MNILLHPNLVLVGGIIIGWILLFMLYMLRKNNNTLISSESKSGTNFAVAGTLVLGTTGLFYGLYSATHACGTSDGTAQALGISCNSIKVILPVSYTIGGLLIGFALGAIIGLIIDAIFRRK